MKPLLRATLVYGLFAGVLSSSAWANGIRCQDVFFRALSFQQATFEELARLHILANGQASGAITAKSAAEFSTRFALIADRIGHKEARGALRRALANLRGGKSDDLKKEKRQQERQEIGPIKISPKLVKTFPAADYSSQFGDVTLPDGSSVLYGNDGSRSRLTLKSEAPYFEISEFKIPEPSAQLPEAPRPTTQWSLRKTDSGWIALGKQHKDDQEFWVWNFSKGPEAVWRLPLPLETYYGFQPLSSNNLSPNGRFVLAIDEAARIHRLDLNSGEIKTTAAVDQLIGVWVKDDGSIDAWNSSGERFSFDKDLTPLPGSTIEKIFGIKGTFSLISGSPDHKQAILLTHDLKVFLLDFTAKKKKNYVLKSAAGKHVVWRKDHVWVAAPYLQPIPRDFGDAKDIEINPKLLHDGIHRKMGAWWFDIDANQRVLVTDEFDTATHATIPFDRYFVARSSSVEPSLSGDGRLVAFEAPDHNVVIFDRLTQEAVATMNVNEGGKVSMIHHSPQFGPDHSTLLVSVTNDNRNEVQLWRLDRDSGSER